MSAKGEEVMTRTLALSLNTALVAKDLARSAGGFKWWFCQLGQLHGLGMVLRMRETLPKPQWLSAPGNKVEGCGRREGRSPSRQLCWGLTSSYSPPLGGSKRSEPDYCVMCWLTIGWVMSRVPCST